MRHSVLTAIAATAFLASASVSATGLATCDSGPQEGWQSQEKLTKQLTEKGWKVRRIKVDGGCYEVYALNEKGERVEAYFHPKTLDAVPTKPHK
ncbi:MAG: PepSY domain-containing protein [Candidatus Obscuribacterales bacterium]|nr:PepSY domain-containing protein [Steroidobacteraceae bacterium]